MAKVWFITGASSGLGLACAREVLNAGQPAVVCARRLEPLQELAQAFGKNCLPLKLDVTNANEVRRAVDKCIETFGGVDVLLNSAGIGYYASVEECEPATLCKLMETNLLGALNLAQAALPHMRARKSGHIVQISSLNGVTTFPLMGAYSASKWALEGLTETLALEVAQFNIKVTLAEPGPFETGFHGAVVYDEARLDEYAAFWREHDQAMQTVQFAPAGLAAKRIMEIADMDDPPLHLALGPHILDNIREVVTARLNNWAE